MPIAESELYRQGIETVKSPDSYVHVRSEPGAAIEISNLRPVACESLLRIGNRNDGGYVVPLDAVQAAGALVSFGLSHNWSFERDFKRRNASALIHCYDHTVSLRTALQYSFDQFLRFFVQFNPRSLWNSFTWISYLAFFRADRIHFKQRLWRDHQDDSATIDDVFARLPDGCQTFVKMDIEGSEYRVIEDLLRHSKDIVSIAIEFHDVDILSGLFNSLVEKIKQDFYIVHIHGNNLGGRTPDNFPMAPEITFLNKRFFDSVPSPSRLHYPVAGLDHPNHPRFPEFSFEF